MKKTSITKPKLSIPQMFASLFAPLDKFQMALCDRGYTKKPSSFVLWFKDKMEAIVIFEKILVVLFVIIALFTNAYLLLILPAMGALIFYRNRVKWLWWKLKVHVIFRNYYEHRRDLYKMGSLYHHIAHKRPKRYGKALIWGQSESIQKTIFHKLQKSKTLTKKEYIKL